MRTTKILALAMLSACTLVLPAAAQGPGPSALRHLLAREGGALGPLVRAALDGSSLQKITTHQYGSPAWFPQGDKIVFAGRNQNFTQYYLYTANPDGSGITPLVQTQWNLSSQTRVSPVPSLNAKYMIAFHAMSSSSGPEVLYLVAADGSGLQAIYDQGPATHASWVPDARALYALLDGALTRIDLALSPAGQFVVAGLTDVLAGTPLAGRGSQATDVSADGQLAVLSLQETGNRDLWVVPLANPLAAYNLTNSPAVDEIEPCFGPGDSAVYFAARSVTQGLWGVWRKPLTSGPATPVIVSAKKSYRAPFTLRP